MAKETTVVTTLVEVTAKMTIAALMIDSLKDATDEHKQKFPPSLIQLHMHNPYFNNTSSSLRHFIKHLSDMSNNASAVTLYTHTTLTNKVKLAQRLTGGAIIHVTTLAQAKIAESAGASCVIVSDPSLIKRVQDSVPIPIMANARVGHFVEAQILEALGVDYIDENELLHVADVDNFINKHNFRVPFVSGCKDLGDGLRRVREGAAMIRTQGDQFVNTVKNVRKIMGKIRVLNNMDEDEVFMFAKELGACYDVVVQIKQLGRLPVVHFASGGIVTPADAAMMMQLGCDGIFVGSEIFECSDAYKRVRAIVQAVRNYNDVHMLTGLNLRDTEGSY